MVVGAVPAHDEQAQFLRSLDVEANLAGPLFPRAVVGGDAGQREGALLVFGADHDMRHVAVHGVVARALLQRGHGREAVAALEIVADEVGVLDAVRNDRVLHHVAGIADEGVVGRFVLADPQAAELDPGEVQRRVGRAAIGVVEAGFRVGLQRAEFGFLAGPGPKRETRVGLPGVLHGAVAHVHGRTAVEHAAAVAAADIKADVAADAQAGLGTRDVEVAGAVNVANADVFSRLRLGDDNRVRGMRAGNRDERCGGAGKKALDVHFLTSPVKCLQGSIVLASGRVAGPSATAEKDAHRLCVEFLDALHAHGFPRRPAAVPAVGDAVAYRQGT